MITTVHALTLPARSDAPASPAVPAEPVVEVGPLLTAFRLLQMQHAKVLHHESAERGLNATDARFVFFLAAADGQGVTPKQAGGYLELSTGAMTSLIDRLADRTLIERHPNPNDRRSVLLRLTPAGIAIADEIGRRYANAFEQAIPAEQRPMLTAAFLTLGAVLRAPAQADS